VTLTLVTLFDLLTIPAIFLYPGRSLVLDDRDPILGLISKKADIRES